MSNDKAHATYHPRHLADGPRHAATEHVDALAAHLATLEGTPLTHRHAWKVRELLAHPAMDGIITAALHERTRAANIAAIKDELAKGLPGGPLANPAAFRTRPAELAGAGSVLINPECRDGKHRSCDHTGWDVDADRHTTCPCTCHAEETAR